MKRTNSIISHRVLIGREPSPLLLRFTKDRLFSHRERENELEGLSKTLLAHKDWIISGIHSAHWEIPWSCPYFGVCAYARTHPKIRGALRQFLKTHPPLR